MSCDQRFHRHFLHVVAAVIVDSRQRILISRRHAHLHQGGLWEFPGGKVEPDEDRWQALQRELHEELGIDITSGHPLITVPHDYGDRQVYLDVWKVTDFSGVPHGKEGQPIDWVAPTEIGTYSFPSANLPIVQAATLPHHYLITPEPGEERDWPHFLASIEQAMKSGIRLVQLRSKQTEQAPLTQLTRQVQDIGNRYDAKILINGHIDIARELGLGVHLTSSQLRQLSQRPLPASQLVAASCHEPDEIHQATEIGVDFCVVSPVKPTASHPAQEAMGWSGFEKRVCTAQIPCFALGGMAPSDSSAAFEAGAQGIAAIRSLWPQ